MLTHNIQLPEPVLMCAQSMGEEGRRWIAGLGESIAYLEDAWSIRINQEALKGGTESLVVHARSHDGSPAVLKIGLPGSANLTTEAAVYQIAAWRGYPKRIRSDNGLCLAGQAASAQHNLARFQSATIGRPSPASPPRCGSTRPPAPV